MERKKWWASLIAVAVGLAFAVGSASAYEQGDFADEANEGKLIPYYMAGDNLATIIGVQNAKSADNGSKGAFDAVIIEVSVHDKMGAHQASGALCLMPNQFGYAVIKEKMMMDDMDMMESMVVLEVHVGDMMQTVTGVAGDSMSGVPGRAGSSVMTMAGEGMIASEGFAVIKEMATVANTGSAAAGDMVAACDQPMDDDGIDVNNADGYAPTDTNTAPDFATWAILQDVGDGSFFGTELPSATVKLTARVGADGLAGTDDDDADGLDCNDNGADCEGMIAESQDVTVRFDNDMMNDSMSMIYLWLDSSMGFVAASGERSPRRLTAMVYCEGAAGKEMLLNVPDQANMIYGSMLGCEARGVVTITMGGDNGADGVGMGWSHISQMGGGFRMNFPGYESGS